MRLSKIKLAGFKSFVDPTTLVLPSNLVGVVGPNGCGKSNTIDAVRWVMGESSARHLRGDSMEDVIFSGSTARKPVSQASVELTFDNSDGSLGGEYARYSHIAVKRLVSREGQSTYYFNGSRCRRRDITDIFLGTGLGPRSYAIIEQGMISRLIEAKPDEMRVYIEEAAGISRYKDRRRETENRIRHTRENLDRLNDLREEVGKQIAHLKKQARTAERFKSLKQKARRAKSELLVLHHSEHQATLVEREDSLKEKQTVLEKHIAKQRRAESEIEQQRNAHASANDRLNEIQGQFYKLGADISRLEQQIQHDKETHQRQQHALKQHDQSQRETHALLVQDQQKIQQLRAAIDRDTPQYQQQQAAQKKSAEALAQATQAMSSWQNHWDDYNRRQAEPLQIAQVERSRTEQFERQLTQLKQRSDRQKQALDNFVDHNLDDKIEALVRQQREVESNEANSKVRLQQGKDKLHSLRQTQQQQQDTLDKARLQVQTHKGRLSSLEALQQTAMGQNNQSASRWLTDNGLHHNKRLAQQLTVENGWELALETVLGGYLESVCVEQLPADLSALDEGRLAFYCGGEATPMNLPETALLNKISAPMALPEVLNQVHTAEDHAAATQLLDQLAHGHSVITRDGIWLGKNWLRVHRQQSDNDSILARGQEIKALQHKLLGAQADVDRLETSIDASAVAIRDAEQQNETTQAAVNATQRAMAEAKSQLNALRMRQDQIRQDRNRINQELSELTQQQTQCSDELALSNRRRADALARVDTLATEGEQLQAERDRLREQLDQARLQAQKDHNDSHEIALRMESMRTACQSTEQNLARVQAQLDELSQRRVEIIDAQSNDKPSIAEMETALDELLGQRLSVEQSLADARQQVEQIEQSLRQQENARAQAEQAAQKIRDLVQSHQLANQELRVRIKTLEEQIIEGNFQLQELIDNLPEGASIASWADTVASLDQRIQRLGSINLAAIEEHAEQELRKQYLDSQYNDLTQALATLEAAIEKIDRETRSRFKETFEKVNAEFQGYFPRLFGGGHANLAMMGNDLLNTGVSVMVRPPGKRISNIQLLSGGEKALTAVALVFAFFELNPAPFCMLDEVDAPLDDANIGRYCELVREMSRRVQFIFITHNKTTMELAAHLMGVTMHEPGVSRLVSVDIDKATEMSGID